jgi:hypothetical protein
MIIVAYEEVEILDLSDEKPNIIHRDICVNI